MGMHVVQLIWATIVNFVFGGSVVNNALNAPGAVVRDCIIGAAPFILSRIILNERI